ncbi:MAG: helix-turn-helix domain-containing protein [Lachnospiraceae bacterium]|nr:helix-turn-helix domain-containing protein [Lachnospiraceae bacterium]
MQYTQEEFRFSGGLPWRLFRVTEKQKQLHCHNCLELNLAEKGTGTYIIGGKLYPIRPGDIFVINNSERHLALHDDEELTLSVLIFDTDSIWKDRHGKEYLKPFFHRAETFSNRITSSARDYQAMRECFERIGQEEKERRIGWELVTETEAHLLLALLYRCYHENQEIEKTEDGMSRFGRLEAVLTYIDSHFTEPLTLDQLAKEAAVSRNYLCKCFREATGQTLFAYIEQTRIQYAAYLLQTTEEPVARIAVESGFESVSYFNRLFRRQYEMSPGQFRRGRNA